MTLNRVNTTMTAWKETWGETKLAAINSQAVDIEKANTQLAQARSELVRAMREARESHTLQEIGDAAGLSRERVRQLLEKEEK